jgi:putative ABC transport system ATP-binding protein
MTACLLSGRTHTLRGMPIIDIQGISKLFGFGEATTLALDEVSLSVESGEFIAVMGPSGCGKSTLMNIIGMLDRPTHGEYLLHARHVARLSPNQAAKIRRDTIGFIFQSQNLVSRMTVLENVALPLVYKGMSLTKRLEKASRILERVGMQSREYFLPAHLSGGQVQCAAIARALVNDPQLIIADEPTGNLDSAGSRLVMELLNEVHRMGNTVIFVTHNPELTRYANRVVYMRDGAIIADESTAIGSVASGALKTMYAIPKKTQEDDLAGVSSLMQAVPQKAGASKTAPTKRGRRKTNRSKKRAAQRKTKVKS